MTPLILEVWGGVAREGVAYLRSLAAVRRGPLTAEAQDATWATRCFASYWGQRLSLTLQRSVAQQILSAAHRAALTASSAARGAAPVG